MGKSAGTVVWDIFIAHAAADEDKAELLYDLLAKDARVFLDTRCMELGDDWDTRLADAQRTSLVTVVLISSKTEQAYYAREEIAAAIALAREAEYKHRVVPLYLETVSSASRNVLYGLTLKHSLRLSNTFNLADAAKKLLALVERLHTGYGRKDDSASSVSLSSPGKRDKYTILRRNGARQRIDSYIDELQAVLQRGVVDRDGAMMQLNAFVTLAQAAEQDAQYLPQELESIFNRGSEASRIIALVLAQVQPTAASLPMTLEATSNPRSPWEQYFALLVLDALVLRLTKEQKQQVRMAIRKQQGGGPGEYIIRENVGRWNVASRIMRNLKKGGSNKSSSSD